MTDGRQILKAKLPFRTEWEHQQDLADIKQKLDEVIPSSRFHDRSQRDSKGDSDITSSPC